MSNHHHVLLFIRYRTVFLILSSGLSTVSDLYSWHRCRNVCRGRLSDRGLDISLHSTSSPHRQQPASFPALCSEAAAVAVSLLFFFFFLPGGTWVLKSILRSRAWVQVAGEVCKKKIKRKKSFWYRGNYLGSVGFKKKKKKSGVKQHLAG